MAGYKTGAGEIESGTADFCDGIDDVFLNKFLGLFSGREGVYALQHIDAGGRAGYRPVREALDNAVFVVDK